MCSVIGCGQKHYGRGFCRKHWWELPATRSCTVSGCAREHKAKGLCSKHYDAQPWVRAKNSKRQAAKVVARRMVDPAFRIKDNAKHGALRAKRLKTDPAFKIEYASKRRVQNRVYKTGRLAVDSLFKFKENIRCLILCSLKSRGFRKDTKTAEILGCSFEQVVGHTGWRPGLEIHHIKPLYLAKTEEDVIRLNHYTNLTALKPQAHDLWHKLHDRILMGRAA